MENHSARKSINISTVIVSFIIALFIFALPESAATVEAAHARKITRFTETNTSETAVCSPSFEFIMADVEFIPSVSPVLYYYGAAAFCEADDLNVCDESAITSDINFDRAVLEGVDNGNNDRYARKISIVSLKAHPMQIRSNETDDACDYQSYDFVKSSSSVREAEIDRLLEDNARSFNNDTRPIDSNTRYFNDNEFNEVSFENSTDSHNDNACYFVEINVIKKSSESHRVTAIDEMLKKL